jgi:hypothetical protein
MILKIGETMIKNYQSAKVSTRIAATGIGILGTAASVATMGIVAPYALGAMAKIGTEMANTDTRKLKQTVLDESRELLNLLANNPARQKEIWDTYKREVTLEVNESVPMQYATDWKDAYNKIITEEGRGSGGAASGGAGSASAASTGLAAESEAVAESAPVMPSVMSAINTIGGRQSRQKVSFEPTSTQ